MRARKELGGGGTIKTHLCMYKILKKLIKNHSINKFLSLKHKDLKKHFLQFKSQGHFGFLVGRRASK